MIHSDPERDGGREAAEPAGDSSRWGVDSEYGLLRDVLLGPPEHFRWLPTSAISKATLESGAVFDPQAARAQHSELVSAYEEADVRVHMLNADPHLPYQVFARDSSTMIPEGAVVLAPAQQWRRGEYAPVIRFYQRNEIPIRGMISAGAIEGGDVTIVEPGCMLIGNGEERTQVQAAEQLAGWIRESGWEVRIEPIPGQFVHIDVLVSILAPKLAAVCVEAASGGLVAWLRAKGFEILEVSIEDAFRLGVNAMSLGGDRVISTRHSQALNEAMRAHGLTVLDPDLSAFTAGGGGAHCLAQALRREPGSG
jgi:N-dimethylarginine dimethylaminohydrolase